MLLLAASLLGGPGRAQQAPSQPVVIASPGVQVETLDRSFLRAVFGMKHRNWPDGRRIEVFVLPDRHPVHIEFSKKILGIFPHNLRRVWDRQVYSGTGQSPREVESEEQMRERVSRMDNAIGYLGARPAGDSVKVLTTR